MITTELDPTISHKSYVQWGAVITGTVVSLAIALVLIPFGNGIGLSMNTAFTAETAHITILKVGVWILISQFISSALGGYFAGKSVSNIVGATDHENEFRDGLHGLLSWGVSLILTAIAISLTTFFSSFSQSHTVVLDNSDLLKKSAIIFNFTVGSSALVSAVIAWFFASKAGHHRDTAADLSRHFSFRKRT